MPFGPDLLVTSPDAIGPALVVEVKLRPVTPMDEEQLKRYMARARCPAGLIVTPEKLFVYRNMYTGYDDSSVEQVGEFSMAGVLGRDVMSILEASSTPESRGHLLEDAVQDWIEGLTDESAVAALPSGLREAVEEHVIPALSRGRVRAARPRWERVPPILSLARPTLICSHGTSEEMSGPR